MTSRHLTKRRELMTETVIVVKVAPTSSQQVNKHFKLIQTLGLSLLYCSRFVLLTLKRGARRSHCSNLFDLVTLVVVMPHIPHTSNAL